MIISMTGYGRSEVSKDGVVVSVELRSVNNRFLEISTRMPRELNPRENDIREILRKVLTRGKINVNINLERPVTAKTELAVDPEIVKAYKDALDLVRKAAKIKEVANLTHLHLFADLLQLFLRLDDEPCGPEHEVHPANGRGGAADGGLPLRLLDAVRLQHPHHLHLRQLLTPLCRCIRDDRLHRASIDGEFLHLAGRAALPHALPVHRGQRADGASGKR